MSHDSMATIHTVPTEETRMVIPSTDQYILCTSMETDFITLFLLYDT